MIGTITNHLWQSTAFAVVTALLTLAFRRNRAQVRYWLWFSASLKFLVPFTLLMAVGSRLELPTVAKQVTSPTVSTRIIQITEPFTYELSPVPSTQRFDWRIVALLVWALGAAAIVLARMRAWRRISLVMRDSAPLPIPNLEIPSGVNVRSVTGLLEPAVLGSLRPVLLLPSDITHRLSPHELRAVVVHELCHIRRRDNLTSAIHMFVEALFWFHPLVWWIGGRLVEERERACDEEVLRLGNEPLIYAEGILNVCKNYLESPLRSVSGVSGSNLKKRIQAILTGNVTGDLNFTKKLTLAAAAMWAVAIPFVVGMTHAATMQNARVTFEVASVRPVDPAADSIGRGGNLPSGFGCGGGFMELSPGRLVITTNLYSLVAMAYGKDCVSAGTHKLLTGGPGWVRSDLFTVQATMPEGSAAYTRHQFMGGNAPKLQQMLQSMLSDRFTLSVHPEMQEMQAYALTVAKSGSKLKAFDDATCDANSIEFLPPPRGSGRKPACSAGYNVNPQIHFQVWANGTTIEGLAQLLTGALDRPVIDRTKIPGVFEIHLESAVDGTMFRNIRFQPSDSPPNLFTAIEEQLGLKLEAVKAPVEVLVIDQAEKPAEN
jgi:uncharacterized protein (TIGR03435 family)